MNAIIISAVWGAVMMFSGIVFKQNARVRVLAIIGLVLLLAGNIMEMQGMPLFNFNTHNMLYFEAFGLLFNCIAFGSTLLYFLLSGSD